MFRPYQLFFLLSSFLIPSLAAQVASHSDLFKELIRMDSLLFDAGYNHCDLALVDSIIDEDFEFFHDQGGVDESKAEFMIKLKNNICMSSGPKPIRKLESASLKVYPLYANGKLYGALQNGMHQFYLQEPNRELYLTSTARFMHIWIRNDQGWKLKRVVSFDHQGNE